MGPGERIPAKFSPGRQLELDFPAQQHDSFLSVGTDALGMNRTGGINGNGGEW